MTTRSVSASLKLDIKDYLAGLASAKAATDRFVRDIDGLSGKLKAAGQKAGRNFGDGLGDGLRSSGDVGRMIDDLHRRLGADESFRKDGEKAGRKFGAGLKSGARSGGGGGGGIGAGSVAGFGVLAAGAAAAQAAVNTVPPAIYAVAGALAAIPSVAAGAMAAVGSLGLGLSGVGGAVGDVFADVPSGGGGGGGASRAAANERRLAAAQREAKRAQEDVTRARQEATRELRDMSIQLNRLRIDERGATRDLADAERDLAVARVSARDPQEEVRDAETDLQQAREALRDVQRTRGHTESDVAEAQARIRDAERELAASVARAANPDDGVGDAQQRVDEARQSLVEIRTELKDYEQDTRAAQKAGVEGSDKVRDALERQQAAMDALADAQESMVSGGSGGAAKLATAYDKLSPNAKKFVDVIKGLKPELLGVQQLAQQRIFRGLDTEVQALAKVWLPVAERQVKVFGDNWNTTFKNAAKAARDPAFVGAVETALGPWDRLMDGLNDEIGDTFGTLKHLLVESAPFVDRFNQQLVGGLDDFNRWIDEKADSGELAEFFDEAADAAEDLFTVATSLGRILIQVIDRTNDGADGLDRLAEKLDHLADSGQGADKVVKAFELLDRIISGFLERTAPLRQALADILTDPALASAVGNIASVMGVVFDSVAGLLKLFDSLPSGLKEAILTIAGLALAFGSLQKIVGTLGGRFGPALDALGKLNDKLRNTGPAGERAARGLERLGKGAKVGAAGLVGLQIVGQAVSSFVSDLDPNMARLEEGMAGIAANGRTSGEAARVFGEDISELGDALNDKLAGGFESAADGVLKFGAGLVGADQAWTRDEERIRSFDAALADMVRKGHGKQAMAAIQNAARNAGKSVDEVTSVLPAYSQATKDTKEAQEEAARTAAEESRQLGLLRASVEDVTEAHFNSQDALFDYRDGLEDMDRVLEENFRKTGQGLTENSRAGRENIEVVQEQVRKAQELYDKRLLEGWSVRKATEELNTNIGAVKRNAGAVEGNKQVVDKYVDAVKKTPRSWLTTFNATGLDGVISRLRTMKDIFATLPIGAQFGTAMKLWDFAISAASRRWGGVVEHARFGTLRDPAVFSGARGPLYGFAEPETGGEAFVPKYGRRSESLNVLGTAAGWYGMQVVPQSVPWSQDYGRPAFASAYSSAGPSAAAIGAAVAAQVVPALQAAVASVGGTTVVPLMDATGVALMVRRGEQDLGRRG